MTMTSRSVLHDLMVSRYIDGQPFKIRLIEIVGERPGPSTAFVGGIYGEDPLSCLNLIALYKALMEAPLQGSVFIVPAANLPALAIGTRANPDGLLLNRCFPGTSSGSVTTQIAHVLFDELRRRADCIIDFHCGSPTLGAWFVQDHGDTALAASFGVPVVQNLTRAGQLAATAAVSGMTSCIVEMGRCRWHTEDVDATLQSCLEALRYRGHLNGPISGPATVPLFSEYSLFVNSTYGAYVGDYDVSHIGSFISAGEIGQIRSLVTGEPMETLRLEKDGWLILANACPQVLQPGNMPCMVGHGSSLFKRR